MVCMDAGYLGLLLHPAARPPNNPASQMPLTRAQERIEKLVDDLSLSSDRIIIPTPALCEFLVLAGNEGPQYLSDLMTQPGFRIRSFDQMAAVELAAMELLARSKGNKRLPSQITAPWQKIKFDRQIVAIAKIHGAHTIYSDDSDIKGIAEDAGIKAVPSWDLPLPPSRAPLFEQQTDQ